MKNWKKGCDFGHIDKFWKGYGQTKKNACKNAYLGSIFIPEKYVFRVCFESPFTRMISSLKYKCPPPGHYHISNLCYPPWHVFILPEIQVPPPRPLSYQLCYPPWLVAWQPNPTVFALYKGSSLYQEADFETHFSGTSPDRHLY